MYYFTYRLSGAGTEDSDDEAEEEKAKDSQGSAQVEEGTTETECETKAVGATPPSSSQSARP